MNRGHFENAVANAFIAAIRQTDFSDIVDAFEAALDREVVKAEAKAKSGDYNLVEDTQGNVIGEDEPSELADDYCPVDPADHGEHLGVDDRDVCDLVRFAIREAHGEIGFEATQAIVSDVLSACVKDDVVKALKGETA